MFSICLPIVSSHRARAQAKNDAGEKTISLDQAVADAVQHSPVVRAAKAALESARVQADRERPVARPTVTAVVSGVVQGPRVDFPHSNGQLAPVLPEAAGRLDVLLDQPLYHAGYRAAYDRYLAMLSAAGLEFRKTVSDMVLTVRKAYVDMLRAEAGVVAAQDGVEAALRYQRLVQRQIAAGLAKPVDGETVVAQVAEAQVGFQRADGARSLAKFNLNRLLGRAVRLQISVLELSAVPSVPSDPNAAIANADRLRPELLLLDQQLQAARAGVSLARAQTQPSVNARAQVSEQTPSAFQHEHYYGATLELRLPLLDGGKARQDVREARAQIDRIQALKEDARLGIELETVQAWEKMRGAQARAELARTRRAGLDATELVAEKAYEVGRGTVFEVQAAQREVRTAQAAELEAKFDLHTAYAEFLYAQGSLSTSIKEPSSSTEVRP